MRPPSMHSWQSRASLRPAPLPPRLGVKVVVSGLAVLAVTASLGTAGGATLTAADSTPAPAPAMSGALSRSAVIAKIDAVYAARTARPVGRLSDSGHDSLPAGARKPAPPKWLVGFARQSLDPTKAMIAAGFHLGGFGLGPTRQTTGPAVDGDGTVESLQARAMAVSNRAGKTLLLAGLENQGTFASYKQGPYGIWDIRQQVSLDTGVPVDMIIVNSDHSHSGPDLIGLWGGVPVDYMRLVFSQTVKALDEAYANRVPAFLSVGTSTPRVPSPADGGYLPGTATPGENLVHSQFNPDNGLDGLPGTGYDDSLVDTQLRVLQATDVDGNALGTLINYSAHADVMGSSNLGYSADWPGRVARATEQALNEPVAVTMVADVGRSQPPRPHSDAKCGQAGHPSCDIDQLDTWTNLITPWVLKAVREATPVTGRAVTGAEAFTREVATNPALLGTSYSGEAPTRGTGAYRAATPPWVSGDLLGTFASAHRIGDILLTANPGEAYPDIRFAVTAGLRPPQAFFTFGLANDQVGYLIAPASEYGWISASQVGNDNSFFNVSAQYGDHLVCTEQTLAARIGFISRPNAAPYGPNAQAPQCPVLAVSDGTPMGPAPQQPWLAGDGTSVPPQP